MHEWPTTLEEAREIQQQLRSTVITEDQLGEVGRVAGVDAGFTDDQAHAAIVVLDYPSLQPLDYAEAYRPLTFPYVPGFLSFREAPVILDALGKLQTQPDLIICDGQGLAHPRRFGIACHIGVLTDIPALGCAKSRLIGEHDELPEERGEYVSLLSDGEEIGVVLRSRHGVKPLYISAGHRISLSTAIQYIMGCVTRYRLPAPIRAAHDLASNGRVPQIATRFDQRSFSSDA